MAGSRIKQTATARAAHQAAGMSRANLQGLIFLLLALAFIICLTFPASAVTRDEGPVEVRYNECLVYPYGDLDAISDIMGCNYRLTLPSSMAFKCSLYVTEGYPSELLRKVCILYDRGIIQDFLQGAARMQ